jgi:hypothetical protein
LNEKTNGVVFAGKYGDVTRGSAADRSTTKNAR